MRASITSAFVGFNIFTARIRRMGEGTVFSLSVHTSTGGGVPDLALDGRGTRSSLGWGGYPIQPWMGGYPIQPWTGGYPPPPVKGKIFDTRFGLIHVQTGKKFFRKGTPPPPLRNSKHLLRLRGGQEDFLVI